MDKFVEFFGPGVGKLSLPDRATIANMAPEYGATMGFFPVDAETLRYLGLTGRSEELVDLVERYCKAQGLFRTDDTPIRSSPIRWAWTCDGRAEPRRSQTPAGSRGTGRWGKTNFRMACPDAAGSVTHHHAPSLGAR